MTGGTHDYAQTPIRKSCGGRGPPGAHQTRTAAAPWCLICVEEEASGLHALFANFVMFFLQACFALLCFVHVPPLFYVHLRERESLRRRVSYRCWIKVYRGETVARQEGPQGGFCAGRDGVRKARGDGLSPTGGVASDTGSPQGKPCTILLLSRAASNASPTVSEGPTAAYTANCTVGFDLIDWHAVQVMNAMIKLYTDWAHPITYLCQKVGACKTRCFNGNQQPWYLV